MQLHGLKPDADEIPTPFVLVANKLGVIGPALSGPSLLHSHIHASTDRRAAHPDDSDDRPRDPEGASVAGQFHKTGPPPYVEISARRNLNLSKVGVVVIVGFSACPMSDIVHADRYSNRCWLRFADVKHYCDHHRRRVSAAGAVVFALQLVQRAIVVYLAMEKSLRVSIAMTKMMD
jgi:hypothetical protein